VAKRFVFLEINDSEIIALISGLREIATGSRPLSNVHITVRGPYSREISARQVEKYRRAMRADPILFQGVGNFQAKDRQLVYLAVHHPGLRRIWWKPDFPVRTFGFNPHVTIYEGTDADRASRLTAFLRKENLKLVTWDFSVTPYVSDHRDLFQAPQHREELFLGLVNRGLVRPDILTRLIRVVAPTNSIRALAS
jgi:hypothetical protein